ncbi:glycoside hydrolase family 97 catalytic domain-containing protein, partial [candidate division KSB1 bacterium]|nr:glycoside hydrolase family 97 catalytic domain-containing protein [candidate division KSB1 bacterium]
QINVRILYKRNSDYIEVLPYSPLGISRKDQQFVDNLTFVKESKTKKIYDNYKMICGKRKICENSGVEKVLSYKNANDQPLDIVFRVYNDGVAFRYVFPNQSDSLVNITGEATTYVLADSTDRWMQPYNLAYEGFFPFSKTGLSRKKDQEWCLPALFKVNDEAIWALISEANITENNCATMLCNLENLNQYKVTYPSARDNFPQTGVVAKLPWSSQWHTLMIGELSDIVESTLITDVSDPNKLENTDWIKPGPVSWIYWAYNHGSKDYQKVVEYVDLAVEMNWPYMLIDWEWNVMTNGGNIVDAVNYANSKGIKPLMWYNSGTSWLDPMPNDRMNTAEKRAKEFTWLNEIGVYGIKVDFFAGDQQDVMKFYIDILKDAANYHLMVNFHGSTVPRGWARTYPNLMTMEAVYGAEWYNNRPTLTNRAASHNTVLPFTRNVIGSMDYTPVTFSNSQHPHITSYGHELALSVVFESGFQHFADRPSAYNSLPPEPKEFLKIVPVSWDDTKLIDGYPGEKVVIARRKGKKWYIGGLNGKDEAQTLQINFNFLDKGNYSLHLIKDGNDDKSFSYDSLKVKKGDSVKIECLPRGGFVGILNK